MVTTIEALRLEVRKQWDAAHDYKCNRRDACESFGRTGHRCKYPPPEILNDERSNTSTTDAETSVLANFDDRQTGSNPPHDKC